MQYSSLSSVLTIVIAEDTKAAFADRQDFLDLAEQSITVHASSPCNASPCGVVPWQEYWSSKLKHANAKYEWVVYQSHPENG